MLGGAVPLAALMAGAHWSWQDRYKRQAGRHDEQAFAVEDGCLVLASGRMPTVHDITSPLLLGVHKAHPAAMASSSQQAAQIIDEHVPAYVPRDIDAQLRERVASGGFVLLVGDSTAGKSRAAFEAMAAMVPGHLLIRPGSRSALGAAIARAAQARRCVLWLDDLENYLGPGGLSVTQIGRLVTGQGHRRVIIATLRAAEQARLTGANPDGDDSARQILSDVRQVLDQAYAITIPRIFTASEKDRAETRDWDPRIAEALRHADAYGIAEYLAAGPELLRDWEDARSSSAGPHARGAALVAAAIDIRLAGQTSPAARTLVEHVHEYYLSDPEHARIAREPIADAWAWATRQRRATTALLHPVSADNVEVFDYLTDVMQRRTFPGNHAPEPVVRAAIDFSSPDDADSLAATAAAQARYALAEYGYRQAYRARASDPDMGTEHPATLASHGNLARVLGFQGRLEEAETEERAVLEARARVLGAEHPETLTSRSNLAIVIYDIGRLDEAETELRAVLEVRTRILGTEDPATQTSRHNLAVVLRDLGRLEEAEAEERIALDVRIRDLGAEHPATLTSRSNLAAILQRQGRLEEAETVERTALEARIRVLGREHPATVANRSSLSVVLRDLGRLEEAEAEERTALDVRIRISGAEHPATLTSRSNLAAILQRQGRLEEAETEERTALEARIRVLGHEHPATIASRSNHAAILRDLGHLRSTTLTVHSQEPIPLRCRIGVDRPGFIPILGLSRLLAVCGGMLC